MTSRIDQAEWLARRQAAGGNGRRWSKAEIQRLDDMVGHRTLAEIAAALGRTANQVRCKLQYLGYSIPEDLIKPLGCNAIGVARRIGVPYEVVWRAIRSGQIAACKQNKKDYLVRWAEVRRVERWIGRIQARRERALAAIRERTISKQELMARLRLGETQVWRYLAGHIVRAWKVPCRWQDTGRHRWEWRVSEADARRVQQRREAGRLRLRRKAYREIQRQTNEEIRRLRREKRLGKRDDLKHARSSVVPGHYTVAQVASHVGLSGTQVYHHIRAGRLAALSVRVGNRNYLSVPPEAVPDYLAWTQRKNLNPWAERKRIEADRVRRRGYLTLSDAAERFGLERGALAAACRAGRVRHTRIGRLIAVRESAVRRYSQTARRRK